jgi:hypothetical protein
MKHLTYLPIAFSLVAAVGCSTSSPSDASLTIVNQETYAITDIYIGPSDGTYVTTDNLLAAGGPMNPGDSILISVQCDAYDVEIIDQINTYCYVPSYSLCGTNDTWLLDDVFFATCSSTPRVAAPQGPAGSAATRAPLVLDRTPAR